MKPNIYQTRIDRLKRALKTEAFLITDPIDLYYFTGLDLSAGKLLVSDDITILFVDGRYIETAASASPVSVELELKKSFNDRCIPFQTIGIDSEKNTVQSYMDLNQILEGRVKPQKGLISELRSIKDDDEISLLQQAAELGSRGYDFLVSRLSLGDEEKELALALEFFWRNEGAKGVAFDPIIAFGAHSSMPHYRAGVAELKENEPVLLDIGVTLNHYHSDMTRMAVIGELSDEMKGIFEIVQEAHHRALELVKPGTSISSLDRAARDYIDSKGFGVQFSHSLGHGIGLEVHEFPTIRSNPANEQIFLKPGMAITIEPGIYLPGKGGVRLEDTLIVTDQGYKNITNRPICCHSVKKSS